MNLPFLRGIALVALTATGLSGETHPWNGDPKLGARDLEAMWKRIERPPGPTGIRGVFRFALEAAGLHWHPERVEAALVFARSMQNLDPQSRTYGNFKWRSDHADVFDQNAVEFSMQQAALMRLHYSDRLSPRGLKLLDELLTTSIEGIHRHSVKPEYTNIYLMKAWNLIAIGEALSRPEIADEGYRQFRTWVDFVVVSGISEFGGGNYYGTDLDSLALIYKFAARPDGRKIAEAALRYLWTDIAANWWAPGDRLGGANSRSYDYLYGRGYLEAHTWPAGWLRTKPELEGAGWLTGYRENLTTFLDDCSWLPPESVTEKIRAHIPRVVVQRWSYKPLELRATQYIGFHASIGSSGASHGSDDRALVANLGDSPEIPQVIFFMDARGDPYGTRKTENAASQAKALHVTPFIATVQRGPEVLQLLSWAPSKSKKGGAENAALYTHLTVPRQAEVWSGDHKINPGSPSAPAILDSQAPVFLRLGDAVLAVRFLAALTTSGSAAAVHYITDTEMKAARRLTIVHSEGPPRGRGSTLAWFRVADGLDEVGFSRFRHAFASATATVRLREGELRASVKGLAGSLAIEADINREVRHKLEGEEPDALLSVNGEDVGKEILADYGAQ